MLSINGGNGHTSHYAVRPVAAPCGAASWRACCGAASVSASAIICSIRAIASRSSATSSATETASRSGEASCTRLRRPRRRRRPGPDAGQLRHPDRQRPDLGSLDAVAAADRCGRRAVVAGRQPAREPAVRPQGRSRTQQRRPANPRLTPHGSTTARSSLLDLAGLDPRMGKSLQGWNQLERRVLPPNRPRTRAFGTALAREETSSLWKIDLVCVWIVL